MLIDLSPLLSGQPSTVIAVANVRLGEAAKHIDRSAVTAAEYEWTGALRTEAAEVLAPSERPERFDGWLPWAGVIRCGPSALSVRGGWIDGIIIRGPSLAALGVEREEDIAARFGAAATQQETPEGRLHHYPMRGLVIAWDPRAGGIGHVALGGDRWSEPRLGARDLRDEMIGVFERLDRTSWAEPSAGSLRVRYQRIAALARALGLGTVRDVVEGHFLRGELNAGRDAVLDEVAARSKPALWDPDELEIQRRMRRASARNLFTHLVDYRRDADRLIRATSGWMVCSDPILLGLIATQDQLARRIEEMMTEVDRWLCSLMDPDHRTFALRDLIAHHGWPDVDVTAMEADEA